MFELAKKLNVKNCVNSKTNCVHYIYRMSGCVEKLNIQNNENSKGNCARDTCTEISKKLNVQNCVYSTGKCTLRVRNVWSCRKIKYSEQCKLNG